MKFYQRRRVSPVITIVSLVDILTMVLMFFVYTTTFKTSQTQVQIVLPEVKSVGDKIAETVPAVLAIDPQGGVFLDDKPITLEALGDAAKKLQADNRTLQLKADTKANFGRVMEVMDALKIAGVPDISALMQEKK